MTTTHDREVDEDLDEKFWGGKVVSDEEIVALMGPDGTKEPF